MGILTEDMKRLVSEQRLGFVATVCPDEKFTNYLPDSLMLRIEPLEGIGLQEVRRRKFGRGSCSEMAFLFYARRVRI